MECLRTSWLILTPEFHCLHPGCASAKVSKLLLYQGVRSRKFYRFEGVELMKAKVLNRHVTELAALHSFDNLNKTDVIWSSTEAEDMEAALHSIVEATPWMDWWTFALWPLVLKSTDDGRVVVCLWLVPGTSSSLLRRPQLCWLMSSLRGGVWSLLRLRTLCPLSPSWTSEIR